MPTWTDARRSPIRSLADIQRIEAASYADSVPVRNTYQLFLRSEALFGDRTAMTWLPDGNPATAPVRYTYRELRQGITAAANMFRAIGIGPEDAVALLMPPCPEGHFALWGAEIAGRACPINNLLSAEHIAAIIDTAGAKAVVALGPATGFDIAEKLVEIRRRARGSLTVFQVGGAIGGDDPKVRDFNAALQVARCDRLEFDRDPAPDDIAAYFHTGGTTGAPKLARHTHGNEVHTSWFGGLFYDLRPEDVVLCGLPLFHVAGAFVFGAATFVAGANLVLPTLLGMRNADLVSNLWAFVERERVTQIAAVPTVLAMMLSQPVAGRDISSLRAAFAGGSPLPTELAGQVERSLRIPVRNIYGMTESAGLIGIIPLGAERVPVSCGWRLPYTQVQAVEIGAGGEPRLDRACPPGTSGVLVIRGPHVSPGYTDAARNAGMFAEGWLVSGDLGHIDLSGQIHVTGRAKDVIIRGAHNIDPAVIEEAILKHPAVQTCAAVGEPDAHAGEVPVVYVALKPGATAQAEAILAAARPYIPEPPAVPKRCTIIETMPQTAVGKIYKPALRTLAIERAYAEALRGAGIAAAAKAAETPRGHMVTIRARETDRHRIVEAVGRLPVAFEIVAE